MQELEIYQVDAFADRLFSGNPAAVVPLSRWLPDHVMQAIAAENNLAETAFVIPKGDGQYDLRWFTPGTEVRLCGHATLATAHILYTELDETSEQLVFDTLSGRLSVVRRGDIYELDFPADTDVTEDASQAEEISAITGNRPQAVIDGTFLLAVYDDPAIVRGLSPSQEGLLTLRHSAHDGCLLVTAPGDGDADFVSRLFAPGVGIPEDPVTGSAHCMLAPFWAGRLGRDRLTGYQASSRGGTVICEFKGERVLLRGEAVTYLRGRICF